MVGDRNEPSGPGVRAATRTEPSKLPSTEPAAPPMPPVESPPDTKLVQFLRRFEATGVGEEISPYEPAVPLGPRRSPWATFRSNVDGKLVLAAASGLLGTLIISGSAPIWKHSVPSWHLSVPFVPRPPLREGTAWTDTASLTQALLFALGMVLVSLGWIGLVRRSERMPGTGRQRAKWVLAICVLWAIPVMLGPPLLSNDAYSYAAQGEMSAQGLDPTDVGPATGLGRGEFVRQVDPFWRHAPAPYGPVWVLAGEGAVVASGHDPMLGVWMFRLLAIIGVAITVAGLISMARSYRVPVALALAVGIGNPLVILHLIGGGHNDALMMGFLVCGVAAHKKGHRWLAVALITMATAIKLPAIVALGILAWQFEGTKVLFRRRLLGIAKVGGFAVVSIAVLSVAAGIGLGWVKALQSTGKVMDTMSLTTLTGFTIGDILHLLGSDVRGESVVNVVRMIGVLAGAALAFKLLIQSGKVGIAHAIGLSMILMVVFGPVVWPWYLPAGFALLAGSGLGKWRPSYLIGCLLASFLVWPNNIQAPEVLVANQRYLMLSVCIVVMIAGWFAQRHAAIHGRYLDPVAGAPVSGPPAADAAPSSDHTSHTTAPASTAPAELTAPV